MRTGKTYAVVAAALAVLAFSLAGSATAAGPESWILLGVTPTQAAHGQLLTISGTGLDKTTAVAFNGIAAPQFTVAPNGESITVIVPAQAPNGSIYIEVTGGDQGATQRIGPITIGSGSVPVASVKAVIRGFAPLKGRKGTKITISGSNFTGISWVKIGGANAAFSVSSAQKITAIVPKAAHSGRVVVHAAGGSAASSQRFTVLAGRGG